MLLRPHFFHLRALSVLPILLTALSSSSAADKPIPLCEEFQKLVKTHGGFIRYRLEAFPDREGINRIPNIDVDGDGLIDEVRWSCPGSGGVIPADPCTLSVKLSSGNKIEFEESRFSLVRYRSKIYAVAADYTTVNQMNPNPADVRTKIYQVDKFGVRLVCSKL